MSATTQTEAGPPVVAGRIGVTLLCVYLLAVTMRIGGCYGPDGARRDELSSSGPALGASFPDFTLRDVNGVEVGTGALRGSTAVIAIVPSLDWSAPTKARLLDLADAVAGQRNVRVAILIPAAQATPRGLTFVHDRKLPFFFLVDDGGVIERLGLGTPAPDGTASAHPATFVLDTTGHVVLRDVRKDARFWLAPEVVLHATPPPAAAPAP